MSQRLQIANAVPLLLAEALGIELAAKEAWTDSAIERDGALAAQLSE